ncbi:unnamed protein product, partial [Amoebophrya sp. A120]|eukprot:GSA120T00021181001.1
MLLQNRELAIAAVCHCGRALRFLHHKLRDDDDICHLAVAQNRNAMQDTSQRFQNA